MSRPLRELLNEKLPEDLDPEVRRKFHYYADKLDRRGVLAGTYHRRVTIPKASLDSDALERLGFVPVMIAVPESGQDSFISYRHPELLHHIHSHGPNWTMHEDTHPSLTMALRSAKLPSEKLDAMVRGTTHVVTEGIPGLGKYLANRFTAGADMVGAIKRDLQEAYKAKRSEREARKKERSNAFQKRSSATALLRQG